MFIAVVVVISCYKKKKNKNFFTWLYQIDYLVEPNLNLHWKQILNVRNVWAFFLLQLTCLPLMVLTAFSKVQQLEPVRESRRFNTAELDYQVLQKVQGAVIEFPGMTLDCII